MVNGQGMLRALAVLYLLYINLFTKPKKYIFNLLIILKLLNIPLVFNAMATIAIY